MSTEPSEKDCSEKAPVLRNDFLMESVQTTVEDWPIAGPSNASPSSSLESDSAFCPVHSPYAHLVQSNRGESSATSFDSAETAIVADTKFTSNEPKTRVTFVQDPQSSTSTNELSDPPAYEDIVNVPELHTSSDEECAERYWQFAKIVRNSLCYNIFFDVLLLTVSISAIGLALLYIKECIPHFELFLFVLLMGVNGFMCSLSRLAPLVIQKLRLDRIDDCEWIFKSAAVTFFLLFILTGIAAMIVMASSAKHLCLTFAHYMVYVNFGFLIIGILTFSLYLEVLVDL
ncbi:uncharacterized protein TNIN_245851 [Trichonephila inaurata madagascariensis]|uniref:Uncharacterized protein n=1 Tax=Trichonephila inaurata madagascariensis TaxID=2747483 RepID=A0A8X7C4K1_9ARAC|nr:uncharacterized protein TNIN_245851 [Trichonephila inaurata madagascariensis]